MNYQFHTSLGNKPNFHANSLFVSFSLSLSTFLTDPKMKKLLILILAVAGIVSSAFSQKSKHGSKIISSTEVVNEYTSLSGDATSGDLTISVANANLNDNGRFSGNLEEGDLLFIIQVQGASINDANRKNSSWGEILNYNNAGLNEYVEVASVPNATTINLNCPLQNDYTASGNVVLVRVPRYSSLNVQASGVLTGDAWDGSEGGFVVVEVEGNTTVDGEVSMSEKGFRGTASASGLGSTAGARNEYASTANNIGGLKGEGIAGYHAEYNLLKGEYGIGAAANAGGAGSSVDAGGGGGANVGDVANYNGQGNPDITSNANYALAWEQESVGFSSSTSSGGGRGGYSKSDAFVDPYTNPIDDYGLWGSDGRRVDACGQGGRPLDYSTGRLFLGGGGGQGHGTDQGKSAGGAGGGMIFFKVEGDLDGAGKIVSNGQDGESNFSTSPFSFNPDGGGGAGAGGTIILDVLGSLSVDSVIAVGGIGGSCLNLTFSSPNKNVGPGGGGGGGYVRLSSAGPNTDVSGGSNGLMISGSMSGVFEPNGATYGGVGEVVVQSVVLPLLIGLNDTVCEGETANLEVQASNLNGATLTWYDAYSGGSIIGTGSTLSIPNLTADSTVYVGVCPGTFKIPVLAKLRSKPLVDVVSDTVYACAGASARLEATGGNTYSWYPSAELDQDDQAVANIITSTSQTIYVEVSIDGACVQTDSVYVEITPNLVVDLGLDKTICFGESVDLNASGGVNYTWSPNIAISSTNLPDVTVNPSDTTKYYVLVDDGVGCMGEDSITVNVLPAVSVVPPANQELCKGELVNLSISHTGGSGGSVTYTWDEGALTGANQNGLSWASSGTMEVKVVDDFYGCQDSANFNFSIRAVNADFTYSDTCYTDVTSLLSASSATGSITSTEWTINNSAMLNGANTTITFSLPGSNSVKLVVTDDLGCKDSIEKNIFVKDLPVASISIVPNEVCVGYNVLYTNFYIDENGFDYSWDFGNGATSDLDSGIISYAAAGKYYIDFEVTDANGCSRTAIDSIEVIEGPVVDFTIPESVKLGETFTSNNTTTGGQIFHWTHKGDTISDEETSTFTADEVGELCYKLIVLSQAGCRDSLEKCITVEGEDLLVPNIFTPNNDGFNDYLEFVNAEGKTFSIEVYNRWGLLVYKSDNYKGDWNGVSKSGVELSEGTYFVVAQDLNNPDSKPLNGFVYLTK